MSVAEPLRDPRFRRLYAAQVVALVGTGLLTVALGLVAVDIAHEQAGVVLGTALAIKMIAYVAVAPMATALTVHFDRKAVLITADVVRAAVALALPFVGEAWQIYVLVFVLQSASATFTPAFQSVVPVVLRYESSYTRGLSLSRLAYDVESIASPMIAAAALTVVSFHSLFIGTSIGFLASMCLVARTAIPPIPVRRDSSLLQRTTGGIREFVGRADLRGLAAMNLVAATATSLVVVNSVVFATVLLSGPAWSFAFLLGCFGAGSIAVALCVPRLLERNSARATMTVGCVGVLSVLVCIALVTAAEPTGLLGWGVVSVLWVAAGAAVSAISTPSPSVVRRACEGRDSGPLFTAQFSLSHACFLLTYPIAGWVGASAGQVASTLVLALVATLGTVAAVGVWRSSGGGSDGQASDSRTELRTSGRA